MTNIELSPRMKTVADMVDTNGVVADIGCDHAFVSIYLVAEKNVSRVIASDVRPGPIAIAKSNVEKFGLGSAIHIRMGDGLEKLADENVDSIVIAGMGGMLITHILARGADVVARAKQLVLQPQSDLQAVRKYLHEQGHAILNEDMLVDAGKYYVVMDVRVGEKSRELSKVELNFGPVLLAKKHPILHAWLLEQQENNSNILSNLAQKNTASAAARTAELEEEQKLLLEALAYYKI